MSRAQFHAKSGAPAAICIGVEEEETDFAGFTGKAQIRMPGAISDNWV